MTTTKPKNSNFVSPTGKAKYAWVHKPDSKFANGGEGQYKIRVLLDDNQENRAWAANVLETAKADAKTNGVLVKKKFKNPFTFPEDIEPEEFEIPEGKEYAKYSEDYRGKIIFEAKSQFAPGLIDTALNELTEDVLIMSGDSVRVKFETNPYEGLGSGVSLRLKIVQLVEKNSSFTPSSGGLNTEGFTAVDGFTLSDASKEKFAKMKASMAEKAKTEDELKSTDPDLEFFDRLVK